MLDGGQALLEDPFFFEGHRKNVHSDHLLDCCHKDQHKDYLLQAGNAGGDSKQEAHDDRSTKDDGLEEGAVGSWEYLDSNC